MSTVAELIRDSLLILGVLNASSAESPTSLQTADAIRAFNRMLATWTIDDLMVYTIDRNVYPLTIGQQSYNIGPVAGALDQTRPVWIKSMSIIPGGITPALEVEIQIVTDKEWQETSVKSVQSTWPTLVYDQGNYPYDTLNFWPIPSASCSVVIYSWDILTSVSSASDNVSLPPGYEEAIVYNLAKRLAPMYLGAVPPDVERMAMITLNGIRAFNVSAPSVGVESALRGPQRGPGLEARRSFGYVVD